MQNVLNVNVNMEAEIPYFLDFAPSLAVFSHAPEIQKLMEQHFVSISISSLLLTEGGWKSN